MNTEITVMLSAIFLTIYYSTCALKRRDNSLKGQQTPGGQGEIPLKQILNGLLMHLVVKAYIEPCFIKLYKSKDF